MAAVIRKVTNEKDLMEMLEMIVKLGERQFSVVKGDIDGDNGEYEVTTFTEESTLPPQEKIRA